VWKVSLNSLEGITESDKNINIGKLTGTLIYFLSIPIIIFLCSIGFIDLKKLQEFLVNFVN
jgi:hypothetical protein